MLVRSLRVPGDSSEEEEEEEETESDEDSDASSMHDFVMQPRASKGGKSSSGAHKRPAEEDDDDIWSIVPAAKETADCGTEAARPARLRGF